MVLTCALITKSEEMISGWVSVWESEYSKAEGRRIWYDVDQERLVEEIVRRRSDFHQDWNEREKHLDVRVLNADILVKGRLRKETRSFNQFADQVDQGFALVDLQDSFKKVDQKTR